MRIRNRKISKVIQSLPPIQGRDGDLGPRSDTPRRRPMKVEMETWVRAVGMLGYLATTSFESKHMTQLSEHAQE